MDKGRSDRLDLRLSAEDKQRLTVAADLDGLDLSRFVLRAALAAAREVLSREAQVALSARDAAHVLELLRAPPKPTADLIAAAKRRLE